jgi:hypothetical protein
MGIILAFLGRVPILVWVLCGLLLWGWYGYEKAARYEQARMESIAETQRIARLVETKKAQEAQRVEQKYVENKRILERDLDRLHTANLSLQQLIASDNHTADDIAAVCRPYVERNRVIERLLKESNGLLSEGAEGVSRLGTKIAALQDYINRVCVTK